MLVGNEKYTKNNLKEYINKFAKAVNISLPTIQKVTMSAYKRAISIFKFELIGFSTCIANATNKKEKVKQIMALISLGLGVGLGVYSLSSLASLQCKIITVIYCLAVLPYMNSSKTLKQIMYSSDKFDRLWQNLGFKLDPENGKYYPALNNKSTDKFGNPIYDFRLNLNPANKIENRIEAFEEIVEKKVLKVETKTIGHIKITCAKSSNQLPTNVIFSDKCIPKDDSTIAVGVSHFGNIEINLRKLPHTLIGGHTGAGKSILLTGLLKQLIDKKFEIYGIDFKKGNALKVFRDRMHICTTRQMAIDMLNKVIAEMDRRYEILEKYVQYDKIDELEGNYSKIVVVVDELGELLSGSKSEVDAIMDKLLSIGRLGRGARIHLVLATQRASANLSDDFTELRDLMGNRISGYASNSQTSIMILNNTMATKIDPEIQGRFVINQHNTTLEFQGFNFSDSQTKQDIIANNKTILTKVTDIVENETVLPCNVDLDVYFDYLNKTKDDNNCVVGYQKAKSELGITEYVAKKFHKELQDKEVIYWDGDLKKSRLNILKKYERMD